MAKVFRIKLLPALHGDCIWIEYGDEASLRRMLVDGGPVGAYTALRTEIEKLPDHQRTFELLVVTHIDADHIDGIVKLMRHPELDVKFQEVWFNGWPQIKFLPTLTGPTAREADEARGPTSGSYLDHLLIRGGETCNARFRGRAACVADDGLLPRVRLEGGLELTLLSPTVEKLRNLRETWLKAFRKLGGDPGDPGIVQSMLDKDRRFRGDEDAVPAVPSGMDEAAALAPKLDDAVANGSSIAFVAEYADRRCALLADAHAPLVEKSLRRMALERNEDRLRLAAVKLSHHGSRGNTTPGLLRAIECRSFLVSTDGSIFGHPDDDAIRCVVKYARPARLVFNYRSDRTIGWSNAGPEVNPDYTAQYPVANDAVLEFDLLDPIVSP